MNEDLYKILGVERNTTSEEIRAAYLAQAKANHPDLHQAKDEIEQNAFKQQFQRVQHAYEVLGDPEERAYYDKYGKGRNDAATSPLSPVERTITDIFNTIFNPVQSDVTRADYVSGIIQVLMQKLLGVSNEINAYQTAQKRVKLMDGRWRRENEPENPLAHAVRNHARMIENQLEAKRAEADHLKKCIEEMSRYTYVLDPANFPVTHASISYTIVE